MNDKPTRIALIDDHTLFRESLRRLLEAEPRFQVVADVATVEEGLALAHGSIPMDLALIDFEMGQSESHGNGLEVLRALREIRPEVHCMMVTAGVNTAALREIVGDLHASLFLKSEPAAELLLALDKTVRNEVWVSSPASLQLLRGVAEEERAGSSTEVLFSPRELTVLGYVMEGLGNKEIADKLHVTESNVKAMLQKLFAKTSVRSRAQLVRFVFESEMELL